MKKLLSIAFAGLVCAAGAGCSATRTAEKSPERIEADAAAAAHISRMLDAHLYTVDFTRAMPMGAPSFPLNHPYYISVVDGHVESMLPYMGRAYSLPYGGGEGLRFRAPIADYTDRVGRKARREISFTARTDEDIYTFNLVVYPTGQSDLSVRSTNKQSISFTGAVDPEPDFEAVRASGGR